MSTNISKKKRDDLLDKIKQIRAFIAAAPQDENTGNLLSYLSELEKDVNGKKYGLVFEEHREEIDEVLDTHTPVLTEDADLFIDHGVQMNFLIEGDNLASLQLLEKTHKGKIDLIYIDPPYNTGAKDFVYDDAFVDTTDGFNHSKWLSFMKQRLSLSKKLLAAHGTIFIINEYYDRIREIVNVKEVNVLTFVDRINTKFAKRNIFILTPERSRELFKNKSWLNIDLILFDEAQLSDEKSVRGLYFDSIVRRALKSFPDAKYVFAHPFISNPEAQLERNGIIDTQSAAINYEQKNVGQIFYVHNPATGDFYHLGTSKEILGKQKLKAEFDPIERAISSGGSVLIYVSKSHIYNKSIYSEFDKYIKLCNKLEKPDALQMIDELRSYIGASKNNALFYNSEMLEKLSLGIVTHHGSMPLAARLILEHFTQSGFCRICFATSTLEQGINMPFDVVYLDKFEASKSLSVKNLIGRAGRSTVDAKFDYGSVVIRNNAITSLRRVMRKAEPLSKISNLDVTDDSLDEKYKEFKEAINTGAFSDEYNLPSADVEKLHSDDVTAMIPQLLDMMFDDGDIISPNTDMKEVNDLFSKLYQQYLGRKLCQAEKSVLSTAVKIMIWKIYGKTFHRICQYRYAYASRTAERQQLYRKRNAEEANSIPAKYIVGYHDIPDKDLTAYPLVSTSIAAKDVDYDLIVYDTYDYLDKLIGFKLSDIFYAIFYQYYEATSDERALRLAKYFKYGTDKEREIWMLRYGFSFEEIEWVSECVDSIDETEIKFNDKINALDDAQLKSIEQYVHE